MNSCLSICWHTFTPILLLLATLTTFSQNGPPNDHFTNSIQFTGTNINVTGSFVGATLEPNETPPLESGTEGTLTIWYSWAAPMTGRAYFTTTPFAVSRWIWAYVGTDLSNLRRVPFIQRFSNKSFLATEGTVYHFQVGGVGVNGDTSVAFNLELRPEVPCDNDHFSDAVLLQGTFFDNWYTGSPMPPLHWTLGATSELGEPAHRLDGQGASLWWKWIAPFHGRLAPETRASTATNVVLAIYQGASVQSLTSLGRFTNSASPGILVTAGETYYIAAAVTNEMGDVFMGGNASANTSFTPVAGNILLNPSFEQGVLFDYWSVSGGYGGYVGENGGADGRSWPSLGSSTRIWQDVPTIPGHQYRIRFIWRYGGNLSGGGGGRSCRVLWDSNEVGIAQLSAGESGLWQCPTFITTASNSISRFMLENLGGNTEYDGCSVVDITAAPAIVTEPRSISTLSGGTAAFAIGASGSAPLLYQWFFNGAAVPGGTNRALVIAPASSLDAGAYYATVHNAFGAATSSVANLNVESPTYPILVWQPYSEKVAAGGYVSFSAVAAGTPPLTYQWYWNEQPMAGATNRNLAFDPVQLTNAGSYKLVVSNSVGSVWSLPATLTVTATNAGGARIHFGNRAIPFSLSNDAPVLDLDAFTRLNGSNYVAQLYAGATLAELRPAGTPSPFQSGFSAGFFISKTIVLPNIAPGSQAVVQVRAWEINKGTTFEEARALGGKFGKSELLNITTRPAGIPAIGLEGLQSFSLQAGLPFLSSGVIHFSHREPQGVAVWTLEGEPSARYVIEKAVQDFNWEPYLVLTNITGTVTFTDRANTGANVVLFRARLLD